jgi:hypothetical protein
MKINEDDELARILALSIAGDDAPQLRYILRYIFSNTLVGSHDTMLVPFLKYAFG